MYIKENPNPKGVVSDFLQAVRGMKAQDAWHIMDELMAAVQITNPRLYDSVMRKVAD